MPRNARYDEWKKSLVAAHARRVADELRRQEEPHLRMRRLKWYKRVLQAAINGEHKYAHVKVPGRRPNES